MTLKKYNKAPIRYSDEPFYNKEIVITSRKTNRKLSMWEFISLSYSSFMEFLTISKVAGLVVPIALIVTGLGILYNQIWPEVEQYVLEAEGYLDQGTTSLVEENYIEQRQIELSDPGSDYFKTLTDRAFGNNRILADELSKNYSESFTLTIPSLDLYDLAVEPNVNSGVEAIYDEVLERSLAHMDGTGLPISDVGNKTVIYGHSSNNAGNSDHPSVAFSRLQKIKIGDEIFMKMNNNGLMTEYKYKVFRTKIVKPEEVDIITESSGKKDLLGFTCYPNGNSAFRFTFEARFIEEYPVQ